MKKASLTLSAVILLVLIGAGAWAYSSFGHAAPGSASDESAFNLIANDSHHQLMVKNGWMPFKSFNIDMDSQPGDEIFASYKASLGGQLQKIAFAVYAEQNGTWEMIAYEDGLSTPNTDVFIRSEGGRDEVIVSVNPPNEKEENALSLVKLSAPNLYGLSYDIRESAI